MAKIKFEQVSLQYPIYEKDQRARSLKHTLLRMSVGGVLSKGQARDEVYALSNLSFELNDGDRVGLVGHNGAGKSTLLRTIGKVYTPNSGKFIIDGKVQCMLNMYMGLNHQLTGLENIKVRAALMNFNATECDALFADVEKFSDLGEFLYLPVRTYSAGMLLRLAFGLSTAVPADILAIDEVVGTGDAAFKAKAQVRLKQFMGSAKIIVMCSHDNDYLREHCNKIMWLDHGKIKMLGLTHDVLKLYEKNNN